MLDNPRKTETLMAALKAAVPFEVELTPEVVKQLQAQSLAHADQTYRTVSDLSYAGDEGGIVCHIVPLDKKQALFISLTHVRVPRSIAACPGCRRLPETSSEEAQETGRDVDRIGCADLKKAGHLV